MNREAIEQALNEAVSLGEIPCAVAAVTGPEGTLFTHAAGPTVLGGMQAVNADTVFWIASMTKPVTSVAAMQLVEQGRLELDAPIGKLLPELENPQILEGGKLRPAEQKITLRQLLTHTAGFSYGFASAEYAAYYASLPNPPKPGSRASLDVPLLFEPGARWEYGLSTDWVGLAVEAASGETLDRYFQKHIFAPLGMGDTNFLPNEEQRTRRALIHHRKADGSLVPETPAPPRMPKFFSGGGGLYSTLNDYQKFLRLFLNQGAGIISPKTLANMTANQIGTMRAGFIPSADPAISTGIDVNPGQESKWGLGFLLYPQQGMFGRNAGSYGWAGVANTYFWVDPAVDQASVILMQILPSGDMGAIKTLLRFEQAVYAARR